EMERGVGGEGPVEETGGKAVMLADREPVPHGITGVDIVQGVLAEIADQVLFLGGVVASKPHETGRHLAGGSCWHASVDEIGPEPVQVRIRGIVEEELLQLEPA